MTTPQILALAVLGVTLALFIWERLRFDIVALCALLACVLLGLVEAENAFDGFGNPAVITVAAVLILSRALALSGAVDIAADMLSRFAPGRFRQLVALCLIGAFLSAFMNNVGALGIIMPIAIASARRFNYPPALILMPISFATMLGGMSTLIGTPPNILIAQFRSRYADTPFQLFDFAPLGVALSLGGIAFIALIGWRLLPRDRAGQKAPEDMFDVGHYVTEVRVPEKSSWAGKAVETLERESEDRILTVSLLREELRVYGRLRNQVVAPGDVMVLQTDTATLQELIKKGDLELVHAEETEEGNGKKAAPLDTLEVVVPPNAWIQGSTARSLQLRARFAVNLLAISRKGRPMTARLRDVTLFAGDVLLLQGEPDALSEAVAELGCLPLANRRIGFAPNRVLPPVLIFAGAIALVVSGLLTAPIAFALGVLGMLAIRSLPLKELYTSIDWPVIVLLGAMIPVGEALETSGAAQFVADGIVAAAGSLPSVALLGLVLVATMALTPILNNAATVVIMAPIVIGIAQQLGVNPDAFLMAVAIGASCDFLTPFGHQNNTLIMGPGGYRFGDFWKLGLPMDVVVITISLLLLPVVWPL